jgi:hypothetical protein
MKKPKIHMRDIRLRNNAGMDFPVCYASAKLLDLDKSALPTASRDEDVTCERCKHAFKKRYPWAGGR